MLSIQNSARAIQKKWILISSLRIVGLPLLAAGISLGIAYSLPLELSTYVLESEEFWQELLKSLGMMFLGMFWGYFAYRRAVVKRNNGWLTVILILTPFLMIKNTVLALNQINFPGLDEALIALNWAMMIWWYVASIQLLRLNRKLRELPLLASEEYKIATQALASASTRDELDAAWLRITRANMAFASPLLDFYRTRTKQVC